MNDDTKEKIIAAGIVLTLVAAFVALWQGWV